MLLEFYRLAEIETDECVIWPYMKNHKGYGYVRCNGPLRRVHVLACEMRHGQRPARHVAAHKPLVCHDRACMNYRHLRWATHTENEFDKVLDGTTARGERHSQARLTNKDVTEIRLAVAAGATKRSLSRRFGVSDVQVGRIARGERWSSS